MQNMWQRLVELTAEDGIRKRERWQNIMAIV